MCLVAAVIVAVVVVVVVADVVVGVVVGIASMISSAKKSKAKNSLSFKTGLRFQTKSQMFTFSGTKKRFVHLVLLEIFLRIS